mmetsp:Transcript_43497/g.50048  ORF Transcript_43497/g.50048 Transcript_43497/m.50048 type:complete len:200 (+) Transcript_43497:216-815(+)
MLPDTSQTETQKMSQKQQPKRIYKRKYQSTDRRHFCKYLGCHVVCSNRFNLKRHVMIRHTRIEPFTCKFCSKKYPLLQQLKTHIRDHLPEMCKKQTIVPPMYDDISITDFLPLFFVETKEENSSCSQTLDFCDSHDEMSSFETAGGSCSEESETEESQTETDKMLESETAQTWPILQEFELPRFVEDGYLPVPSWGFGH